MEEAPRLTPKDAIRTLSVFAMVLGRLIAEAPPATSEAILAGLKDMREKLVNTVSGNPLTPDAEETSRALISSIDLLLLNVSRSTLDGSAGVAAR
jgi:hypothetical protein